MRVHARVEYKTHVYHACILYYNVYIVMRVTDAHAFSSSVHARIFKFDMDSAVLGCVIKALHTHNQV